MSNTPNAFAEVMASSLHTFSGTCWQWDVPPAFGQLVCIEHAPYPFGIVTHITTGPRDAHRTPTPLQKTYPELQREYPHIFQLLQTHFGCVTIGHYVDTHFVYQAPATPASIHGFIRPASYQEYQQIFAHETYMPLLFHASQLDAPIDELILAVMRHLAHHQLLHAERISGIVETFSMLVNNDYRRLKLLLERIEHLRQAYNS